MCPSTKSINLKIAYFRDIILFELNRYVGLFNNAIDSCDRQYLYVIAFIMLHTSPCM